MSTDTAGMLVALAVVAGGAWTVTTWFTTGAAEAILAGMVTLLVSAALALLPAAFPPVHRLRREHGRTQG